MNIVKDPKRLALVVIDGARQRYTRYIGPHKDVCVEGAPLTESEIEHFRINPRDFMGIHCQPEVA